MAQNEVSLCVPAGLLTDGDGAVGFVKVAPLERHQFTFSQSADQLQIKYWECAALFSSVKVCADVVWMKNLHLLLLNFGDDAVLRGIAEDEFFFHRSVQGIVQHHVDASHSGVAQSGFFLFLNFSQPAVALQVIVELLQVTGSKLVQRNVSDSRGNMLFDVSVVVVHGGWANVWFGI